MVNPQKPILTPFFEELQGARVLLRGYHENDAPAFFDAVIESQDRLHPWDDWPDKCQTLAIARAWLREDMARWLLREQFQIGIWDRESKQFLGNIMLRPHNWVGLPYLVDEGNAEF